MKIDGLKVCVCVLACVVLGGSGCVVGQPPGKGKMSRRVEARTKARYFLYLPEDYVKSEGNRPADKKWPLVVTFHGMRPWDSSGAQIREWQQEADRYGFVVIAPVTRISDLLGEIPLRRVSKSLQSDEMATLAIMDEVVADYDVDPKQVLSTSWSMGGYLAHYMVNRHPDRFSCLAVRQSNFSADILDPATVPRYRDAKIAIFYTRNDFAICRRESQQAVAWYQQNGFDVTTGVVERMGHERTPETAAAIFAKSCDVEPKTPPAPLSRIKLTSIPADKVAAAAPRVNRQPRPEPKPQTPPQSAQPSRAPRPTRKSIPQPQQDRRNAKRQVPAPVQAPTGSAPTTPVQANVMPATPPVQVASRSTRPPLTEAAMRQGMVPSDGPSNSPPAPRQSPPYGAHDPRVPVRAKAMVSPADAPGRKPPERQPQDPAAAPALNIRLSAYIGISPMLVSYTVQMPAHLRDGADVLWIDNGEPMSRGISGQKSLNTPGQHKIEVLVVGKDNREYRSSKTVTVLERLSLDND